MDKNHKYPRFVNAILGLLIGLVLTFLLNESKDASTQLLTMFFGISSVVSLLVLNYVYDRF